METKAQNVGGAVIKTTNNTGKIVKKDETGGVMWIQATECGEEEDPGCHLNAAYGYYGNQSGYNEGNTVTFDIEKDGDDYVAVNVAQ